MLASVGIGHSSPSAINSKSLFELLFPVRARTQFLTVSLLFEWNKRLCPRVSGGVWRAYLGDDLAPTYIIPKQFR